MKACFLFFVSGLVACAAWAAPPPLTPANVNVTKPSIRIWNLKSTSAIREGSTTSSEAGKVKVNFRDGSNSTYDATLRVQRGTLFQDGEICHNYGSRCYCATTTYRLESNTSKWKFAVPSNNQPVACPAGVKPTGDPDIKKSLSKEELQQRKREIIEERAAKRR
jgi:hypothetical protein